MPNFSAIKKVPLIKLLFTFYLFRTISPGEIFCQDAAVVVSGSDGFEMGRVLEEGQTVRNSKGGDDLFVLLATGRLERIAPGERLIVPQGLKPRAWFFDSLSRALSELHIKQAQLQAALRRIYPNSAPPDTVEDFLVYPVGSALLDVPTAFKWQARGSEVSFRLYEDSIREPVLERFISGDSLDGSSVADLLKPGRSYCWVVSSQERSDSSYFRVLDERELDTLSARLEALGTLEELEFQTQAGMGKKFGWLVLKVSMLCEVSLYYEAREAIRNSLERPGIPAGRALKLLSQVRMLERYSPVL